MNTDLTWRLRAPRSIKPTFRPSPRIIVKTTVHFATFPPFHPTCLFFLLWLSLSSLFSDLSSDSLSLLRFFALTYLHLSVGSLTPKLPSIRTHLTTNSFREDSNDSIIGVTISNVDAQRARKQRQAERPAGARIRRYVKRFLCKKAVKWIYTTSLRE